MFSPPVYPTGPSISPSSTWCRATPTNTWPSYTLSTDSSYVLLLFGTCCHQYPLLPYSASPLLVYYSCHCLAACCLLLPGAVPAAACSGPCRPLTWLRSIISRRCCWLCRCHLWYHLLPSALPIVSCCMWALQCWCWRWFVLW